MYEFNLNFWKYNKSATFRGTKVLSRYMYQLVSAMKLSWLSS